MSACSSSGKAAPQLRDYQAEAVAEIRKAYRDGFGCPLLVASTGAGKTVIFSYIAHSASERGNPVLIAAHRKEIIKQIALSLARFGTPHKVIAPDAVIRQIKVAQFRAFGRSFVTNDAPVMVGSVQTLVGRLDRCAKTVEAHKGRLLIVQDEAHHVTSGTQWGAVMDWGEQYQARGLLVTASPQRLDGRGLGRGHGGYADVMLKAPPMSWLIENGYLSPYRVFTTPQVIDMAGAKTRMGEYASADLQERADKPSITGDAIAHWRKHAAGMLTVVFCVSIEHSKHVAAQFAEAGIPSAHIDGCTDDAQRDAAIISFSKREILVLTQVNLVSEGFDLGSIAQADVTIDCIIDLAPTKSLVNAMQRWGRALRPAPGKTAVILDHAGNIAAHGFPDDDREWSLEGTKKAKRGEDGAPAPATKTCPKCYAIHRPAPACQVCGEIYEVQARQIEEVAGELAEVTKDAMSEIRAKQRKQQGRARDLDALVASGVSPGRAVKILQAREEKDALVAAVIAAGAREWKHELRSWKPKQLKEYLTTLKGTHA